MVFSSISFLYYFLPIVIIIYFIAPNRIKNLILLLASLVFYYYGEPDYFYIILLSSFMGYIHGLWIHKTKKSKYKKVPLISSIITLIGILVFYKYSNFFINNLNALLKLNLQTLPIKLPIGISFFTFQTLSYTIDVYRSQAKVQKNPLDLFTYVTLFPQLIAGPIVRYVTVESELTNRNHSIEKMAKGIKRFIIGLSKKVLIANTLGELIQIFESSNEKTVLFYWMVAISFTLQIYFDFSGYSDMAIGLGLIFGFHFLENFNYPFISKSITEFWRRWHISLGSWFRDYVYIPLGGNKVTKSKWIRNIIVVWFLTGLWHGAQWNFILWGLYFAALLILEKAFLIKGLKAVPDIIKHLYTILLIVISFVIFNSNSLLNMVENLKGMFGALNIPFINPFTLYYLKSFAVVIIIGIVASTPLFKDWKEKIYRYHKGKILIDIMEPIIYIFLLICNTAFIVDGSFNPFLYFRF